MRCLRLHIIYALLLLQTIAWGQYTPHIHTQRAYWLNPAVSEESDGSHTSISPYYHQGFSERVVGPSTRSYGLSADYTYLNENQDLWSGGVLLAAVTPAQSTVAQYDAILKGSYQKVIMTGRNGTHTLSAGVIGGLTYDRYRNVGHWFGRQYDIEDQAVNTALPTGEPSTNNRKSKARGNLSIGLSWQSVFDSWTISSGFKANSILSSDTEQLSYFGSRRYGYTGYVHVSVELSDVIRYHATPVIFYEDVIHRLHWRNWMSFRGDNSTLAVGATLRVSDGQKSWSGHAMDYMVLLEWEDWRIELNYGSSVGGTINSDGRKSMTLGVVYSYRPDENRSYRRRTASVLY